MVAPLGAVSIHSNPSTVFDSHFADQGGAIGRFDGGNDVHRHFGVFVGENLIADVGGKLGARRGHDDVLSLAGSAAGEVGDADHNRKQHRNKNRGNPEGAAADLFKIFAPGDEKDITHRLCLPRSG